MLLFLGRAAEYPIYRPPVGDENALSLRAQPQKKTPTADNVQIVASVSQEPNIRRLLPLHSDRRVGRTNPGASDEAVILKKQAFRRSVSRQIQIIADLVRAAGVEPARACARQILSRELTRLKSLF